MRIVISLLTLWIFVFSTGCQANQIDANSSLEDIASPVPPPTRGNITPMPSSIPLPEDAGLRSLIEKAMSYLAQRLGISVNEITLVEIKSVVWPDASLGCPQPGMSYTQVPEDGLLIRLQTGGQIYDYHSGGSRDPFLCEKTVKDPNPPPQIDFFNLTPSNPKSTPGAPSTPENSIPPGENQ